MAVTVNLYYSGVNGNARKFAQEMKAERYISDDKGFTSADKEFLRE